MSEYLTLIVKYRFAKNDLCDHETLIKDFNGSWESLMLWLIENEKLSSVADLAESNKIEVECGLSTMSAPCGYYDAAAQAEAQDDAGETVDEWGKPDWVGKEQK